MKCNVGGVDRVLRIVIGLVLVGMAATNLVGIWGWIGIVPLVTGLFRFCPLYSIIRINSCGNNCAGGKCSK
jgi:Protein of unknown function (DUF2892)